MSDYVLIVFDMDGTLLRSDKSVSEDLLAAIRRANEAGKVTALGTGRPVSELAPYREVLRDIRLAVLESGALVYDLWENRVLCAHALDPRQIPAILDAIRHEDIMPQAMRGGASYVSGADIARLDHYQMGIYRSLYEATATCVPEIREEIREHPEEIEKINLYHTSPAARERTAARLKDVPVEKTYAETSSLELSPSGVNKGSGLRELCALLGLKPAQAIAVGDADNDIPMLEAAGLGAAVANAKERVRAAADVLVADNDHDGCVESIERYLLGRS